MTAMARPALLYFLLWLGVTLSSAMDLEKRIYGGQRCGNNERHYHVKLIPKDTAGKESLCSGSLISDQWVLTAAHCLEPGETLEAIVNFHPGDNQKKMTINTKDESCIQKEPNGHDIMLVKLPQPLVNPPTVKLPTPDDCGKNKKDIKVREKYQVAGYEHGKDQNTGLKVLLSSDKLHCATLKAVKCDASFNTCDPDKNFICGEEKDVDTGKGDSGSGAVKGNIIYGVHNSDGGGPCLIPAAATRVCPHLDWILKTAK